MANIINPGTLRIKNIDVKHSSEKKEINYLTYLLALAPLTAESCNWMFSPESFGTVG